MRVESPDHGVCPERTVFSNAWFVCSPNHHPQIAIGLQVLLGALTTGLSAAISGRKVRRICGLKNTTVNAEIFYQASIGISFLGAFTSPHAWPC
jgi:hypothetical protein